MKDLGMPDFTLFHSRACGTSRNASALPREAGDDQPGRTAVRPRASARCA
jgi:hypothetical protein